MAAFTILFYDYLITLEDEIKYAWSGPKSWTFWLFITNRYFPMTYQFWLLATCYSPYFSQKLCDRTAWYPLFVFAVCTMIAQIVLTLRIYAVTKKNIPIAIWFAIITASEFVLGAWVMVLAGRKGAQKFPSIPFDAYHLCIFVRHRKLEVAVTSISLFYDFLAFSLIVFLAKASTTEGLKIPRLLRVIAEDSTRYFLVIFTSHFVLTMTLALGRSSIQLVPAPGNVVYLPVMVSRIMLSLKKAADLQQNPWSLADPTANGADLQSMKFFHPMSDTNGERDDYTSLDTIVES